MAIIYTYPSGGLKASDNFVISDGDNNKTLKLSAGDLLSWIDDNLQYDLQQVLNAGSIADENSGTWNTVEIFRNQSASEKFLQLAPSAGVSGEMKIFSKVIVDKGLDTAGVITSPQSEKLVIIGDGELTLSSSGTVDIAAADYDAQIVTGDHTTTVDVGKLKVTTTENKQTYTSSGDGTSLTNTAFEFKTVNGVTSDPYFLLQEGINLWIKSKVTDAVGNVGTADKVLKSNAQGFVEWADYAAPAAASPIKSIQFNKGNNEFGGEEAFKYDSASNTMEVGIPVSEFGKIKIHSEEAPSANVGQLAFHDGNGQPLVLQPPTSAATDYILTLPTDAPANAVSYLVSDAAGQLSWGTAGGGSASGSLGSIQLNDGSNGFTSGDFTYSIANATLNVGIGNNTNSKANGVVIGASSSKPGALSILGPGGGKVQFKSASTGNASVELTFPDAGPGGNNKILESDSSGNLSWINTPTGGSGGGGAVGGAGQVQFSDGSGNFNSSAAFVRDVATGGVTIGSQAGQISTLSAAGDNDLITQGFASNLGIANFDNAQTTANFSTVVAIRSANTAQSATELVTFYTPIGTTPAGSIVFNNNTQTIGFAQASDRRLKENDADYDKADAKDKIKALNVKKYNFKADSQKREVKGFFADEVKNIIPEAVIGGDSDKWGEGEKAEDRTQRIMYSAFIPYLTGALQEAYETIEKLEEALAKANETIADTEKKADEAKEKAETASNKADEATNKADQADNKADEAIAKADKADDKASSAEDKISDVETKANSALTKASDAEVVATAANDKAADAETKADAADAKATAAKDSAEKADETAKSANETATAAQTKATSVETIANNAKATADDAATTATAAQAKANDAESIANTAKSTADSAQEKATDVEGVANTAKATADSAAATATAASDKATAAETKATAAETKATAAETKATAAEEKATEAETKATAAETKATAAETKATAAEEKATSAETKATAATETATQAKEKADANETEIAKKADKTEEEGEGEG